MGYPIENLFGCPTAGAGGTDLESCMGGNNGPGFGWDDVGTMKFGLSWQAAQRSPARGLQQGRSADCRKPSTPEHYRARRHRAAFHGGLNPATG